MPDAFHLPSFRDLARHAAPAVVLGTVVPTVAFWLAFTLVGTTAAIVASTVALYAAMGLRAREGNIPGTVVLAAVVLTVRAVIALATGSVFLYFLQPAIGTVALSLAFLVSVPLRHPLAHKLALDFVPLPQSWVGHSWFATVFERITLLWAVALFGNALSSVWLLSVQSTGAFVWTRGLASLGITVAAIGASTVLFVLTARRNGARVVLRPAPAGAE